MSTITRETLLRVMGEMHPLELYDLVAEVLDQKGLDWDWSTGEEDVEGTLAFTPLDSPYDQEPQKWGILIKDHPGEEVSMKVLMEMFAFTEESARHFLKQLPARLYDPKDFKLSFTGLTAKRIVERLRGHGFCVELH